MKASDNNLMSPFFDTIGCHVGPIGIHKKAQ